MAESEKWDPLESLGPTGVTVAQNIARIRRAKTLTYTELASRLEDLGRVIPTLGLRKIESGGRRVDTDDLIALALALDVSPTTLLMPPADDASTTVNQATGVGDRDAENLWDWIAANQPLAPPGSGGPRGDAFFEFVNNAWPTWRLRLVGERIQLDMSRPTAISIPATPWLKVKEIRERRTDGNNK